MRVISLLFLVIGIIFLWWFRPFRAKPSIMESVIRGGSVNYDLLVSKDIRKDCAALIQGNLNNKFPQIIKAEHFDKFALPPNIVTLKPDLIVISKGSVGLTFAKAFSQSAVLFIYAESEDAFTAAKNEILSKLKPGQKYYVQKIDKTTALVGVAFTSPKPEHPPENQP